MHANSTPCHLVNNAGGKQESILQKSQFRSTLIVISGYLAATMTGFLRQAVLAFYLGAGRETDIFLVAFSVPEFAFIAFPIILPPIVIPLLTRVQVEQGEMSTRLLVLQLIKWLSIILILGVTLSWLLAPIYTPWLASGFSSVDQWTSMILARQMAIAIFFMGLSSLTGAVLQVYRSFARPAYITSIYNFVFVIGLVFLPIQPVLMRTVWSVILGSLATLLVQFPVLVRLLKPDKQQINLNQSKQPVRFINLIQMLFPYTIGYGVHHLILFIDRAMATTLSPGDVAAVSYARNLSLVIVQISGLAISTVMFPALAEQLSQRQFDMARNSLVSALRWVWALAVPVTAGIIVLRVPLVEFLLQRGAFQQASTYVVSNLLAVYSIAALIDALCQPLWRLVYGHDQPSLVFYINGVQTGIRFLLNILLIGSLGVLGLALSAALGLGVQVLILGGFAVSRFKVSLRTKEIQEMAKVVLAALIAAALGAILMYILPSSLPAFVMLLIVGGVGLLGYAGLMYLFGSLRSIWCGAQTI